MIQIRAYIFILLLFAVFISSAQVGINQDGSAPDASAMLHIKSNNKGFLVPRLTESEISVLPNPANGLLVFNTDDSRLYFYDDNDEEWKELALGTGEITPILTVTNPTTGKSWIDRNHGASQVATSSTDSDAYGDLYQWGRLTDGHEKRTSGTSTTLSTTDVPGHDDFILTSGAPNDWRNPQNDNLWQGTEGTNNPCPVGYRLPTESELEAERLSWATNNAAGAYGSVLKLTVGGYRAFTDGLTGNVGTYGYYHSSTVNGTSIRVLYFDAGSAQTGNSARAVGNTVRCIQD